MKKIIVLLLFVFSVVAVSAQSTKITSGKKRAASIKLGKTESYCLFMPSNRHIVVSTTASDNAKITFGRTTDSIPTHFIATALQVRKMNSLCDHAGENQVLILYACQEGNTNQYRLIDFRIAPFSAYHSCDYSN